MTVLTNIMLALLCFFFVYKLKDGNSTAGNWKNYFSYMGISTFLGAVVHGFEYYTGPYIQLNLWLFMQILIVSSIYFAETATAKYFIEEQRLKKLKFILLAKLSLTAILILIMQDFLVVVINIALGLVPVMYVFFHDYKKNQNKGALLIAFGILISFSSAIIFVKKIALSIWFNHNDIGHVITMVSLYLMYEGAMKLDERKVEFTQAKK
ncbi:MAG: hypothetical protein M3Q58_09370 [Bacteroidota bacterium]|nr:hypothetical protein [Bacteroidota bacterium]